MQNSFLLLLMSLTACGSSGTGNSSVAQKTIETVVFMGDSITAFWPLNNYFVTTININKGIPGDDPAGMLARFTTDVIALKPFAVVIISGTNHPLPDAVPTVIAMAQQAQAAGIKPIICLIPPRGYDITAFNVALKAAAIANGFEPPVDFFTPMTIDGINENTALFQADLTHPNKAGYDVMATTLTPVLLRETTQLNQR